MDELDRCCGTCELCMPISNGNLVCADVNSKHQTYGEVIENEDEPCENYKESFASYMDRHSDK